MIITLTGASGAGKTTIAGELLKKLPVNTQMISSYTTRTRKPRESDLLGEYKYVSNFWFWLLKTIGAFLWTVYPHGNSYGTTKRSVIKALKDNNKVYIMLLTPNAVKTLNDFARNTVCFGGVVSFYVLSPSQEILRERLNSRGDQKSEIEKRLTDCVKWDSESRTSDTSYEFVKNESTIKSVAEEVITRFLKKLDGCDSYF